MSLRVGALRFHTGSSVDLFAMMVMNRTSDSISKPPIFNFVRAALGLCLFIAAAQGLGDHVSAGVCGDPPKLDSQEAQSHLMQVLGTLVLSQQPFRLQWDSEFMKTRILDSSSTKVKELIRTKYTETKATTLCFK